MSLTATALRIMAERGLSASDIADIAEAMEADVPAYEISSGAARQRRYRERKRNGDVTRDVTAVTETVSPSPLPPRPPHPTPPSAKVTTTRVRWPRTRRCPEAWTPSPGVLAVGEAAGFSPGEIERELANMRDHEYRDPKSDWDAAARRWLRTARKTPANVRDYRPQPIRSIAGIIARDQGGVFD